MRFVAVKSVEQQAVLMLHKRRGLMVGQRAMLIHALRSRSAEYGIVRGLGVTSVGRHSGWQAMIQDDPRRDGVAKEHDQRDTETDTFPAFRQQTAGPNQDAT